jgi:heterodisulfide reductase subunit A
MENYVSLNAQRSTIMPEKRIGVFICHCGTNIAGVVDVEAVAKAVKDLPDVEYVSDYKYVCSKPGQQILKDELCVKEG